MTPQQIDRFFRVLAKHLAHPATVILTGAAAGSLMGGVRPSRDIDFAVRIPPRRWAEVEAAAQMAMRETGIAANFASDIARWSMIALLDYQRHTRPYRRFGLITVRLLAPAYWAIGKLTRYLDTDVHDVVRVLKRERSDPALLARLWGRALKTSPRSTACWTFRRQVEHFFQTEGRRIWGRGFGPARAISVFHRAAGIRK